MGMTARHVGIGTDRGRAPAREQDLAGSEREETAPEPPDPSHRVPCADPGPDARRPTRGSPRTTSCERRTAAFHGEPVPQHHSRRQHPHRVAGPDCSGSRHARTRPEVSGKGRPRGSPGTLLARPVSGDRRALPRSRGRHRRSRPGRRPAACSPEHGIGPGADADRRSGRVRFKGRTPSATVHFPNPPTRTALGPAPGHMVRVTSSADSATMAMVWSMSSRLWAREKNSGWPGGR